MYKLDPLPDFVGPLLPAESERLDSIYSGIPKSINKCITCHGKKAFMWWDNYGARNAKRVQYECPCIDQFFLYKHYLSSGIGLQGARMFKKDAKGVEDEVWDTFNNYITNLEAYVSRGRGLLFYGEHGNGKTLMATLLLKRIVTEGGVGGYFTTFATMLDNFAAGWHSEENKKWFDKKVRNSPVLVVDDIGREYRNKSGMASSAMDQVFRNRVQNGLTTIITTNLELKQFEEEYSTGTMGLVIETCKTQKFNGNSYRENIQKRMDEEIDNGLTRPIVIG